VPDDRDEIAARQLAPDVIQRRQSNLRDGRRGSPTIDRDKDNGPQQPP